MSNSSIPTEMQFRDSAGRTRTMPIPEHVQVEIAACTAMDTLAAALSLATRNFEACRVACDAIASTTHAPRVHGEFSTALRSLVSTYRPVEISAQALMAAVSKMLAV